MNASFQYLSVSIFVVLASAGICDAQSSAKSVAAKTQWANPDSKGKLIYKTLEGGDKIMDFFYAGYMGGGVSLPMVPVNSVETIMCIVSFCIDNNYRDLIAASLYVRLLQTHLLHRSPPDPLGPRNMQPV